MRTAIVWLILAAAPGGVRADVLTGSGHVVDQSRTVAEFSRIEVASGIRVTAEAGPRGPLVLQGEDNVLPHVRTEVREGTLVIRFEPDVAVRTGQPVRVTLRAPLLDRLVASGGSQLDAATPSGDALGIDASGGARVHLSAPVKPRDLKLEVSGGAQVAIDAASAARADLHISGGSVVTLAGDARELRLDYSGAAQLRAGELSVGALDVEGSGGAEATVKVAGPVRGELSGGCRLHVGPDAAVAVKTSGGAKVISR